MTTVVLAEPTTVTEDNYYTTTEIIVPPADTVCDGGPAQATITHIFQGAPHTDYRVEYVTYNTWITIWVGQTQTTTWTDYNAMTQCWQGNGWYGT
jgi:hypothetical protein